MREAQVTELPQCNFCGRKASYDFKTTMGPWGYGCYYHFRTHGLGPNTELATKLVKREDDEG